MGYSSNEEMSINKNDMHFLSIAGTNEKHKIYPFMSCLRHVVQSQKFEKLLLWDLSFDSYPEQERKVRDMELAVRVCPTTKSVALFFLSFDCFSLWSTKFAKLVEKMVP